MNFRTFAKAGLVMGAVGCVLVASYGCNQQKPKCATGRGDFVAQYFQVSGPADCAKLKGEKLGVQTYSARGANDAPDLNFQSVAIQSESLGTLADNATKASLADSNPADKPYAFGAFSTAEPEGEFCTIPTLAPAVQNLPEVPLPKGKTQAATSVRYEWSNVRVYVTPEAYGTQFSADLTRTVDGVACGYKVIAMYPYVDCTKMDADGNPVSDAQGNTETDPTACEPEANIDAGRATGSGINPDFPVKCDPDLLACVLTSGSVPVLR